MDKELIATLNALKSGEELTLTELGKLVNLEEDKILAQLTINKCFIRKLVTEIHYIDEDKTEIFYEIGSEGKKILEKLEQEERQKELEELRKNKELEREKRELGRKEKKFIRVYDGRGDKILRIDNIEQLHPEIRNKIKNIRKMRDELNE